MPQWLKHPFSIALTGRVTHHHVLCYWATFLAPINTTNISVALGLLRCTVTQTHLSPSRFPHAFSRFSSVHLHDSIHNLTVHPISTCQPALLFSLKSQILPFLCCNAYTTPDKTVVTHTE